MLDLSKLKKGDKVKFRCGGQHEVEEISYTENRLYPYNILDDGESSWSTRGEHNIAVGSPFDIVEIIPKAFDWNDVKSGMAFTSMNYGIIYYIGTDKDGGAIFDFGDDYSPRHDSICREVLERTPEEDQ